jgi:hypothetical protein
MSISNHKIESYEIWYIFRWGCFDRSFMKMFKICLWISHHEWNSHQIHRKFTNTYANFHKRRYCDLFEEVYLYIVTCFSDSLWGLDWWMNLLSNCVHHSELQVIQHYHWSTCFTLYRYTNTSVLSLHLSYPGKGFQRSNYTSLTVTAAHMKSSSHSLIPFFSIIFNCRLKTLSQLSLSCSWIVVI